MCLDASCVVRLRAWLSPVVTRIYLLREVVLLLGFKCLHPCPTRRLHSKGAWRHTYLQHIDQQARNLAAKLLGIIASAFPVEDAVAELAELTSRFPESALDPTAHSSAGAPALVGPFGCGARCSHTLLSVSNWVVALLDALSLFVKCGQSSAVWGSGTPESPSAQSSAAATALEGQLISKLAAVTFCRICALCVLMHVMLAFCVSSG